jgi:hypothetical protein
MSHIEYSMDSPRHKITDGLRSLVGHTGLSPEFMVELSNEGRLAELFDAETRELKTRVELRSLQSGKRSPMIGREALEALAEAERERYSAVEPRDALRQLRAKRAAWV